mmetsp:Transcript_11266/g.14694  ORF Transcript_11266/g.14694 Transcript_11266/m.14694 type:complete len:603 (+) Transcript_11266:306-2114(+)
MTETACRHEHFGCGANPVKRRKTENGIIPDSFSGNTLLNPLCDEYKLNNVAYKRELTCKKPEASIWFQRGLNWVFAYHFEEAIVCFENCLKLDPTCLLAYWGIAYANGPNYNFHRDVGYYEVACDPETKFPSQKSAIEVLAKATALMQRKDEKYTQAEKGLVNALRIRFSSWPPSPYAYRLEEAYRLAMDDLYTEFPDDPEVVFSRIDATMTLKPWRLWCRNTGVPTDEAKEVLPIIEKALSKWPKHPGLCHLYIHLMEMSPTPERALQCANHLRNLQTDAGHALHMASHIDVLIGDYKSGISANAEALKADDRCNQFGSVPLENSFYLGYICHDAHMLVYAAMLGGMEKEALEGAEHILKYVNEDSLTRNPLLRPFQEAFFPLKIHVLVRFGRWKQILEYPYPKSIDIMPYTYAVISFGRGLALAVLGRVEEAKAEERKFFLASTRKGIEARRLHNNAARDLLSVNAHMLRGEILYREGKFDKAFEKLRLAVSLEDNLPYDEPWGIMQPCRHALGALLLEQNREKESIEVYKKDLSIGRNPDNPWALRGLINCYSRNEELYADELKKTKERLEFVRSRVGDVDNIVDSCMCAGKPIVRSSS